MTKIRGLRWWVVALISLGTIINYLSRNALGVLAPTLKDQMGISTQQYSYIVGAFQIGYTIMQPVCGLIVDLIGLRLGFALFAALWSIAGCLQGGVTGWLFRLRAPPASNGADGSSSDPRRHEGSRGMVSGQGETWTGGLQISLLVGARSPTLWAMARFSACLRVFDLLGAAALIVLIGGERHAERFATA